MISGVFFDLGGTLFQHLPTAATLQNLRWALETQRVRDLDDQLLAEYLPIRAAVEAEFAERRFFLHRDLVLTAAARFTALLRQRGAADLVAGAADAVGRSFYALQRSAVTEHLPVREEAAHVMQTLRSWGYLVAIVSNIDEDYLGPLLAREPDLAACDFVLSSEVSRSCKPDPVIFQRAIARAGAPPQALLFVGDSLTNDVQGAAALGLQTAWLAVDHKSAPGSLVGAPAAPNYVLQNLTELLTLLQPG